MKNDLYGSAILAFVGIIQTCFSLPHIHVAPWSWPVPFDFSHQWIAQFFGTFNIATAIDFFPAVGMAAAGFLAALVGIRQQVSTRMIETAICFQTVALAILFVMDLAVPKVYEIMACGSMIVAR